MKRFVYFNLDHTLPAQPTIITPSIRAARALKVPHQSLESLATSILLDAGIRVAPKLRALRLLRQSVSMVFSTADIEGTTRTVSGAVKTLLRSGIEPQLLATTDSSQTKQLASLTATYISLLREQSLIDQAEVLWRASEVVKERQTLLVYGYFDPRPDQLQFINAIAGNGSAIVLPYPGGSEFIEIKQALGCLKQQGWEIPEPITAPPPMESSKLKAHIYPNLELEVRGVLAQVKTLLVQGIQANEIVIVVRDEGLYGPTLLDVAYEYGLPLRALYGIPLSTTRVGAWIQLLLEVIEEKFPFESTARLLRHPLCFGLSSELWQEARKQHPADLLEWQSLGVNLSLLDWPREDTRANWVERLQQVLNKFKLRDRAGRWPREIVSYYELQQVLVDLSGPEEDIISFREFATDVIASLALINAPAQPGRGGVELHTPTSLFGAKYQQVFFLGMMEGIFPAPVEDDPVLDFFERKLLRRKGFPLEDAGQIARREVIAFHALLQLPTECLTFSYPQTLVKEGTLPSPYLSRLGLQAVPPPAVPVASLEEARKVYLRRDSLVEDEVLPRAIHAWNVEKRREGAEAQDEYDGVIGLPLDIDKLVFSATQLKTLGQCPFKWFAEKVLKLAELEEAEDDLTALSQGNLYHRSLEIALRNSASLSKITDALESAFLQTEQELGLSGLLAWEARRKEHLKTLNRACLGPDFCPPEAEFIEVEKEFSGQWNGLQVKGKIDRIDRTSGGISIVDYKTGGGTPSGVKDDDGKASIDIQLSLYSHFAAHLFPGETVEGAYYYSLSKGKKVGGRTPPSEETLSLIAEKIKTHLQTGSYPVSPDIEQKACRYCAYDLMCRKGSRLSRKGEVNP